MALWPRGHLLQRPRVAVGVAEGDERSPGLHVDVAGLHAVRDEFPPRGLDVGDHDLHPFCEPGGISVTPVPITTEHADPGGVSCTNRSASVTW